MTNLRMAVVGVGSLGQHHATKLANFDDVDLVAVADPGADQGRAVANRLDTQWVATAAELPNDLDGVVIATPTIYHVDAAEQFLNAGVPSFVEKPLAATVTDAQHLQSLASQTGTLLQVGHIERFNPAFEVVADRCQSPLYIKCERVSPYSFRSTDIGVVHDLMIHDIDLVLALTGSMPESVEAFGAVGIGPHEDMVVARLKMPGGTMVDLTASRMCPAAARNLQVWTPSGCINANLHTRTVDHWRATGQFADNPALVHTIAASTPDPRTLKDNVFGNWIQAETIEADARDAMEGELRDFITAIRSGGSPRVTGEDAVQAMTVADQVLQAVTLWSYQTGSVAAERRRAG